MISIYLAETTSSALSSVIDFLRGGGVFMGLIGLCSILGLAVTIYKALVLQWNNIVPKGVIEQLEATRNFVIQGDVERLRANLSALGSPLGRSALAGISPRCSTEESSLEAAQSEARDEIIRVSGGIAVLDVIITIAPLLGLLGTASGLVSVFSTLGESGALDPDPAQLAKGIALALSTTIAGLAVAVPAVIAHSYFDRKLEKLAAKMEIILGRAISDYHNGLQEASTTSLPSSGSVETVPTP